MNLQRISGYDQQAVDAYSYIFPVVYDICKVMEELEFPLILLAARSILRGEATSQ